MFYYINGKLAHLDPTFAVLDVGGDDRGAVALGRYVPMIKEENDFEMIFVANAYRALTPTPEEEVWAKMKELIGKRRASQPLDLPSAGSAFKRPVGGYAAALIDQTGLKGFRVGGAAVSEKHAGFVVNLGGATAADVQELLQQVSDKVFERTGIRLEPEVRIW